MCACIVYLTNEEGLTLENRAGSHLHHGEVVREKSLKHTTKTLRRKTDNNRGTGSLRGDRGRRSAILFFILWIQDGVYEIEEQQQVSLVSVVGGVAEEEERRREQLRQV